MKKKFLVSISCLLLCCGLLLALVSCRGKAPEETPEPSNDPSSVEIDDIDVDTAPGGDSNSIVVTPKDPSMKVDITPKDPNANVTILPGDETPATSETATPTSTATPSPTPTPKPTEKPVSASTPTPAPANTPTPSVAPEVPPNIDISADVDIDTDAKGSADISLEDLINDPSDGDVQGSDESVRIKDGNPAKIDGIVVTPKDPGADVVVTPKG